MIKKAAILAAGRGTRLWPVTLGVPKELLIVGDKPIILHVIEQIKEADITDIQVVTGWKKGPLEDTLGSGEMYNIYITYAFQNNPKGLAHAIYQTKNFACGEDIAILSGDNIQKPVDTLKKMIIYHEKKKSKATVLLYEVDNPTRFGVVKLNKDGRIMDMKEKPTVEEAEAYKLPNGKYPAIAGIYTFNSLIYNYIEKTKPGAKNELQITDSILLMVKGGEPCYGYIKEDLYFKDVGTWQSFLETQKEMINQLNIEKSVNDWEKIREIVMNDHN